MGVIEWSQALAVGIQISGMVLMLGGIMCFMPEKCRKWVKLGLGLFMVVFGTWLFYYLGVKLQA